MEALRVMSPAGRQGQTIPLPPTSPLLVATHPVPRISADRAAPGCAHEACARSSRAPEPPWDAQRPAPARPLRTRVQHLHRLLLRPQSRSGRANSGARLPAGRSGRPAAEPLPASSGGAFIPGPAHTSQPRSCLSSSPASPQLLSVPVRRSSPRGSRAPPIPGCSQRRGELRPGLSLLLVRSCHRAPTGWLSPRLPVGISVKKPSFLLSPRSGYLGS